MIIYVGRICSLSKSRPVSTIDLVLALEQDTILSAHSKLGQDRLHQNNDTQHLSATYPSVGPSLVFQALY